MELTWQTLIANWQGMRVAVIGDAMLDVFIHGQATRVSREDVVPVITVERVEEMPGGAANTAVNAAALGAKVRLVGLVGQDDEGKRLQDLLIKHGVEARAIVVSKQRQTLTKRRVVGNSQIVVRFDGGTTRDLAWDEERRVLAKIKQTLAWAEMVIISDYRYGLMTDAVITSLKGKRRRRKVWAVDAKDLTRYALLKPTLVKPNYMQVVECLGLPVLSRASERVEQMRQSGAALLVETAAEIVAVTMDKEGAWIFEAGDGAYRTYTVPTANRKAVGAGDTYIATMALAIASGASMPMAAEMAAAAARQVVGFEGTSTVSKVELMDQNRIDSKHIPSRKALARLVQLYRQQGKRIVFTNGCFDLLHRGHVTYLNQTKDLGEVLIVGVNSDESVRRLKGPERPINRIEDRLEVLAGLSSVDHVIAFSEDTPIELIKIIRPEVFVKGGDYDLSRLPEAKWVKLYGGEVKLMPYLNNQSTTRMITRIRKREQQPVATGVL